MGRGTRTSSASGLATLELWLVNIGLGTLVGTSFLAHVPSENGPKAWLFALAALVSTVATLTLLPGLGLALCAMTARQGRWLGPLQAAVWTAFQVLLFADTRIYNLFGYHFGSQVWDLLYTRGSRDAVHLGWDVYLAIVAGLSLGTLGELWLWRRCLSRATATAEARGPLARWLRPGMVWGVVLAPAIFVEKTLYAQADLARDRQVTALARLFPFYPRLPVEELAGEVLGSDPGRRPSLEIDGLALAYPLATPRIDPRGPRPDILVACIDCWRADMLDPLVAPEMERFAATARRFEDHVSGGNATRFGLFSLLYGLHGSYWFPALEQGRSPVLIDALLELGYVVGVFSSASMNYPELRSTAWARVQDCVRDAWPAEEPWRRDELAAEACARWIAERRAERPRRPYFAFLLLDSPHQTYSHPPDRAPFQPSAEAVLYMQLSLGDENDPILLEALRNRYRNAVRHASSVAGALLDELERTGALDEAISIATGDHGEEFRENGYFGHTSNFTPTQLAVPFLMRGPGIAPGVEHRPTAHVDVPGTLLELLGADPAGRAVWSLGEDLLDPPARRDRVVAGWQQLGLWTEDGIVVVPLVDAGSFDVEVYDYRWRLILDDRAILARHGGALERLAEESRRFLAPAPPLVASTVPRAAR